MARHSSFARRFSAFTLLVYSICCRRGDSPLQGAVHDGVRDGVRVQRVPELRGDAVELAGRTPTDVRADWRSAPRTDPHVSLPTSSAVYTEVAWRRRMAEACSQRNTMYTLISRRIASYLP